MERYTLQTLVKKKKKTGIVILISDKRKEIYQGQRGILYNDERINSLRRHSNPKFVCTK